MNIGIVAPIEAKSYINYFHIESDRNILCDYSYDYTVPAVSALTKSLLHNGHKVFIFTTSKETFQVKSDNLEIYSIKSSRTPLKYVFDGLHLALELRKHVNTLQIIHAHWTYEFALGASFFCKKLPVVCTVRDWAPYIWKVITPREKVDWSIKRLINNYILKQKGIEFVGNSEYTKALLESRLRKRVVCIPNPISSDFIIKRNRQFNASNINVLCISSASINDKRKNVLTLLRAFQLFLKKNPNSKLTLVGNFSKADPYMNSLRIERLLDNVEIHGKVEHSDLPKIIDEATFTVAPSLEETFGNTLIECMARRVPVIGGEKSGAVPYVLSQGKAGYLCDVKDPMSICETMEKLVNNPCETENKVEIAFQKVVTVYSEEVIYTAHLNIYNQMLARFNN